MDLLLEPWPWYVAGPLIALVMGCLIYFGESFGVSSNFRAVCSIAGAGKWVGFFRFNWRTQIWNLVFILGAVIGGFITHQFLTVDQGVEIAKETEVALRELGFTSMGETFVPEEIFGMEALSSWQGWLFLLVGGVLVGFGTRYAGGCTSGHAISGLSNLQWPSLVAVIGFFIGGLTMTHLIFPYLFPF